MPELHHRLLRLDDGERYHHSILNGLDAWHLGKTRGHQHGREEANIETSRLTLPNGDVLRYRESPSFNLALACVMVMLSQPIASMPDHEVWSLVGLTARPYIHA